MVVAVAGLRTLAAVVQQEAHREEVLVSRRGLGCSSSWGCRYFCMGYGWWLVLAHNIGLFSDKVPYLRNNWAMLSLVLSGLTVEAWLVRHRCLSHCSYLMLIPHFKIFQSPSQGGQLCFSLHIL